MNNFHELPQIKKEELDDLYKNNGEDELRETGFKHEFEDEIEGETAKLNEQALKEDEPYAVIANNIENKVSEEEKAKSLEVVTLENKQIYKGSQYYEFEVFKMDGSNRMVLDHIVAQDSKEACGILNKTKYRHDDRVSISKLSPCEPPAEALERYKTKEAKIKAENNKRDDLQKRVEQFHKRKDIF